MKERPPVFYSQSINLLSNHVRDPREGGGIAFTANGGHGSVVNMLADQVIVGSVPITRLSASRAVAAGSELFWDYGATCGKKEELECLCGVGDKCDKMLVAHQPLSGYRRQ